MTYMPSLVILSIWEVSCCNVAVSLKILLEGERKNSFRPLKDSHVVTSGLGKVFMRVNGNFSRVIQLKYPEKWQAIRAHQKRRYYQQFQGRSSHRGRLWTPHDDGLIIAKNLQEAGGRLRLSTPDLPARTADNAQTCPILHGYRAGQRALPNRLRRICHAESCRRYH